MVSEAEVTGTVARWPACLAVVVPETRDTSAVPKKPTSAYIAASVEMGQKKTHAPQQTTSLFDHFVGDGEHP
jgi:hypothetical protein